MDLIRDLGTRSFSGQKKRISLFFCPICSQKVERRKQHGLIQKHCGCNKHGLSGTDEYKLWCGIKRRCYNPKEEKYPRYGGRGITVCDVWRNNPICFINWCKNNGYREGLQIDRIDNDGNYSPNNCRFITNLVNARHKSTSVLTLLRAIEIRKKYSDTELSYNDIGRRYGVDGSLIRQVLLNKIWREDAI